jgi:AbrB family looped-hinge helix DNA binding protein
LPRQLTRKTVAEFPTVQGRQGERSTADTGSVRHAEVHAAISLQDFYNGETGQAGFHVVQAFLEPQGPGIAGGAGSQHRSQHVQAVTGMRWYRFPMEAVVDQAGRVVLPKPIRDALGLLPGTKVDITPYGAGAQILPAGRTARIVEEDGVLVAEADTPVDDDIVFALIDAGRK